MQWYLRYSCLLCACLILSSGLAQQATPIGSGWPSPKRSVAGCTGTTGYLYPAEAFKPPAFGVWRWNEGYSSAKQHPYKPLGTAFLVAPDLLLTAGSSLHRSALTSGQALVWIPAAALGSPIPDSSVFRIASVRAEAWTGVRGMDENYALLQIDRPSGMPAFKLNFGASPFHLLLSCCMDDGTRQDLSVLADEGTKSLFLAEQFPQAAVGSAVLDEQGVVGGILIPGPHIGFVDTSDIDLRLFGNAVQRLSVLPVEARRILTEANLKNALTTGQWSYMAAYVPYLDLLCGTDSELLFLAAKSNNQLLLDTLITMACSTTCFNLNQRDGQGLPLIHLLVLKRNRPALNHLLRCSSVNLNSQDAEGLTALHHAVILGAAAIVKQLLASGAVVNIRDKNGETPLFEAVRKADLDLCKCLLERGAWNGLNREEHKKLRQWAKASGSREVMLLLKKYQNGA